MARIKKSAGRGPISASPDSGSVSESLPTTPLRPIAVAPCPLSTTQPEITKSPKRSQPAVTFTRRQTRMTRLRTIHKQKPGEIEDLTVDDDDAGQGAEVPTDTKQQREEEEPPVSETSAAQKSGSFAEAQEIEDPTPPAPEQKNKRPSSSRQRTSQSKQPVNYIGKQVRVPTKAKGKRPISSSSSTESEFGVSTESENDSAEPGPVQKKQKRSRAGMQGGMARFRPRVNLQFQNEQHSARYNSLINAQFIAARCFHVPTLNELQIKEEVFSLMFNIGWMKFITFTLPVFDALTLEFYSSFQFDINEANFTVREPCIKFQLCGVLHELSIAQFTAALGLMSHHLIESQHFDSLLCDYPIDFDASSVFKHFCEDDTIVFKPGKSKAGLIVNPALKLIHRFLAYTYSARNDDSTIITKAELFFLWCMASRKMVNIGYWLAVKFKKLVKNSKKLYLGSFITALAVSLHDFDVRNNTLCRVVDMVYLDLKMLCEMKLIAKSKEGRYFFVNVGETFEARPRAEANLPADPSTSQPRPVTADDIQHMQQSIDILTRAVQQVQYQIQAWFTHVGFEPPAPPQ